MTRRVRQEGAIRRLALAGMSIVLLFASACNQIQGPRIEPFYAVTAPPPVQELRWANGKTPANADPARAAAPPETDLVRAIYEGLTELDSNTLEPIPAAASSWKSSKDLRTWTFDLRRDAKWTNGEPVTAGDFVRSWKRLVDLGERTVNNHLFQNIVGMKTWDRKDDRPGGESIDFLVSTPANTPTPSDPNAGQGLSSRPDIVLIPVPPPPPARSRPADGTTADAAKTEKGIGVQAVDDHTLRVELYSPDPDFPKLVANTIFRPIHRAAAVEASAIDPKNQTNGAFRIADMKEGSITLERSDSYWKKDSVALSRVSFVATDSAEAALKAYRNGEVDAVTNVSFEPVAVKLLAPFDDFRRTAHNAINFYEVNTARAPFSDRRVRQALALAIDREKLAVGDLQGTTQPAYSFSPLLRKRTEALNHDIKKAGELLENAGYPGGKDFPAIRLVINRNDVQQRVAASVTRMWKQFLNIDSVIIVKETSEMEDVRRSGDYDLLRRGVVLPANDELVNLTAVRGNVVGQPATDSTMAGSEPPEKASNGTLNSNQTLESLPGDDALAAKDEPMQNVTDDAFFEMTAIPLYFPTSYALVKPYILGFELNGLDAPSLIEVRIDNNWQPSAAGSES